MSPDVTGSPNTQEVGGVDGQVWQPKQYLQLVYNFILAWIYEKLTSVTIEAIPCITSDAETSFFFINFLKLSSTLRILFA